MASLRRGAPAGSNPLAGLALGLLLAALALAPMAAGRAWLIGGHALPDDLPLHNFLESAYPHADHHGPSAAASAARSSAPGGAQASVLAFSLRSSSVGLVLSGLAASLPVVILLVWRAFVLELPGAVGARPADRSPAPLLLPPR